MSNDTRYYTREVVEFSLFGILMLGFLAGGIWFYPYIAPHDDPMPYLLGSAICLSCCAWRVWHNWKCLKIARHRAKTQPRAAAPRQAPPRPAPKEHQSWAERMRREGAIAGTAAHDPHADRRRRLSERLDAEERAVQQELEDERRRRRNALTRGNVAGRR